MRKRRPPKKDYYLDIAKSVSKRATCSRARYGAIIVKGDVIVSTGYNGAPRGLKDCLEIGVCLKDEVGAPSGSGYEYCQAVHAEENAIINAARSGTPILDAVMYLHGESFETSEILEPKPCRRCRRALINAGIKKALYRKKDGSIGEYKISEWKESEERSYLEEVYRVKTRSAL